MHGAFGRAQKACDDIERGRLAGTVWTDQADDFALIHGEGHIGDCDQSTEVNCHMLDGERGLRLG